MKPVKTRSALRPQAGAVAFYQGRMPKDSDWMSGLSYRAQRRDAAA